MCTRVSTTQVTDKHSSAFSGREGVLTVSKPATAFSVVVYAGHYEACSCTDMKVLGSLIRTHWPNMSYRTNVIHDYPVFTLRVLTRAKRGIAFVVLCVDLQTRWCPMWVDVQTTQMHHRILLLVDWSSKARTSAAVLPGLPEWHEISFRFPPRTTTSSK